MKRFLFAATALAAFASPAVALVYVCDVRNIGDGGISDVVAIQFEPGASTAMVYDAVIKTVHGEPLEVKLKDRGNGRYRMTYRVNNIPSNQRPVSIIYTVNLNIKKNTIGISGSIPGYSNMIRGNGTCTTRNG